ncbi:MAG: NADH-quinone oxidoreductase subunit H [Deltaproteobacteria bacterium]|nr:NADH-quinone oxidoreductase subunit H [Deltaproteobacteria bacterium]
MLELVLIAFAKCVFLFLAFLLGGAAILSWVERKMSAVIQDRIGPNRAAVFGFTAFGLFHPIADGIKMLFKEDFVPARADKILFFFAPVLSFVPPLLAFMAIPFGPPVAGREWLMVSDSQMGLLFLLAVASIGVYGHTLAGWSSDNKFSLMGALRTSSQLFSYEVGLTLSLLGVFMVYGTIMPQAIIGGQSELMWGWLPRWGIVTQPLGFILFMLASIAETKRAPFDLPEADSELVAGYSTEYSSMRFAMFFLSEFVGILLVSAFGAVLFLGGWNIPFLAGDAWWVVLLQVGAFLAKVGALVYLQMLVRWTVPRMRFDQVIDFGWKYLIPFGLLNLLATAVVLAVWR